MLSALFLSLHMAMFVCNAMMISQYSDANEHGGGVFGAIYYFFRTECRSLFSYIVTKADKSFIYDVRFRRDVKCIPRYSNKT